MWILGIAQSHNGAVALIKDGKVVAAIQAERISRVKRQAINLKDDKNLVSNCVQYCLKKAKIKYSDIQSIAICTPWKVNHVNNETLFDFIGGRPSHYKGTYYVPHHYAHAEYIIHYSELKEGIILVVDGSGSKESDRNLFNITEKVDPKYIDLTNKSGKETVSAYFFSKKNIKLIYRFSPSTDINNEYNKSSNGFLQSIGHYWRWASFYCCGSHTEAGKVMGLAGFGSNQVYKKLKIMSLDQKGLISVNYNKLNKTFTHPNIFGKDLSNNNHYSDIAAMVQHDTENVIFELLKILKKKHSTKTLYYSGGVALNVLVNEKIIRSKIFDNVILNGSSEDNGTAIGSALALSNHLLKKRISEKITDFYGKIYSNENILEDIKKFPFNYEYVDENKKYSMVASLIHKNEIIGWFQNGSEFGPRALGNRSILANASNFKTKDLLDLHIKQRDKYRPYAPAILEELVDKYFDIKGKSPVMMTGGKVLSKKFPSITHIDHSARIQTVNKNENVTLYKLLKTYYKISGVPIILNTSFNLPGEPIVETPFDALNSFSNGALEYLCLGNYLISRKIR